MSEIEMKTSNLLGRNLDQDRRIIFELINLGGMLYIHGIDKSNKKITPREIIAANSGVT